MSDRYFQDDGPKTRRKRARYGERHVSRYGYPSRRRMSSLLDNLAVPSLFFAFALFLAFVVFPAIASDSRARQAAADVGISNPRVVSKTAAWGVLGGCTQSDSVKFKVAGERDGRPVSVKVCAAVPFGGYTVRS